MKNIKFRQYINQEVGFTYWGIFENGFKTPVEGVESDLFTGFQDKNGKDIYENDILYHRGYPCAKCGHIENDVWEGNYVVKIEQGLYCYAEKIGSQVSFSPDEFDELSIIGNTWSNNDTTGN